MTLERHTKMLVALGAWIVIAIVLSGCAKDPVAMSGTDNPDIQVDKLFEHDGCTVYRFFDVGRARYFAKCGDKSTVISDECHTSGKVTHCDQDTVPVIE